MNCCLLSLLCFLFSNLRKKLPSKILLCLSISLLMLLVIFLAGTERVKPRAGCQAVAAMIQYFMLTTFFWMSVEGLNLYRNFVKVFGGRKGQRKFMIQSSVYAWGNILIVFLIIELCRNDV